MQYASPALHDDHGPRDRLAHEQGGPTDGECLCGRANHSLASGEQPEPMRAFLARRLPALVWIAALDPQRISAIGSDRAVHARAAPCDEERCCCDAREVHASHRALARQLCQLAICAAACISVSACPEPDPAPKTERSVCLELDAGEAAEALEGILDWGDPVWVVADACDVIVRRGEAPAWRPDVLGYTDGHTITIVAGDVRWVTRHEWGHVLGYADGDGWMDPRVFDYERVR